MRREVVVGVLAVLAGCGGSQAPDPNGLSGPVEPSAGDPEIISEGGDVPSPGSAEPASAPDSASPASPASTAPAASGAGSEADAILAAHNRARARHCARPLAWSPALAETAQAWADALRDSGCKFEHSQTAYGENLAAGTRLSGENAVALWYDEGGKYNYKRPTFSPATGHFTQVVWAGSKNLGCGFSECQGMRLWVCHYDPPGNVLSLFAENVSPPNCGK